jgi:hypothetical protein
VKLAAALVAFAVASPQPAILDSRERSRVLEAAGRYPARKPITVTGARASRSAGGAHDFFSEGDYWWLDPSHAGGPYIRRDGESNPVQLRGAPPRARAPERRVFELPDGRGLRRALAFMTPLIEDKSRWSHPRDVQYYDEWPMGQPSLLFGGIALDCADYVELWKTLTADSDVEEVVRNFVIRQPLLWLE